MLELGDIVLRGRDVTLRPLEAGDAAALAVAAGESRQSYAFTAVPEGAAGATEYVARALKQRSAGERYPFAIVWLGRVVGTTSYMEYQPWTWPAGCGLQRHDRPDACEIGSTWLAASAQRTRCNSEAKYLLLTHAFETWRVHRVMLKTDARNGASRRAIERLGAKFDGVLRAATAGSDGTVRDSAYYSIMAEEWAGVRDRLRGVLA